MTHRRSDTAAMLSEAGTGSLRARDGDVGRSRERSRRRRLWGLFLLLLVPAAYLWGRIAAGDPFDPLAVSLPSIDPMLLIPALFFLALIAILVGSTLGAGRSPHVTYRPEQIDTRLDDVIGIDGVKEDVVRSLNLFLAHKAFASEMGGTPRRGLLFEGQPGTGKTYLAKAMAREAGVPFLFVSATSFQSMYYGATARKIRSYFKALRKAARQEGGAIGFIEEIDAIAIARGGLSMSPLPATGSAAALCCGGLDGLPGQYAGAPASLAVASPGALVRSAAMTSEGVGGVVNELLVQMQSFDDPTGMQKLQSWLVDKVNLFLPAQRQLKRPVPPSTNVLVIAATNRADNLDPALLRPGRFDRRLSFEPPGKDGRRQLIDFFLARKAHVEELDDDDIRDGLASVTRVRPVMIEHLFDEGLVNALRRGTQAMNRADVERARLVEEVGMGQPVAYTDHEQRLIATHEAGHAVTAWLTAPQRRLEVLTIVKRKDALGMLAHGDAEDVYTRSKSELTALIRIAMGGQAAEELFFGDVSTGPAGDLLYATNVAAQMIGSAGMTDTLISYAAVQGSALSDTNLVGKVLGDAEGRARVERLLQEQKAYTRALLHDKRHLVEALRDALVERHELIGREITDLLEAAEAVHSGTVVDVRAGASLEEAAVTLEGVNPPRTGATTFVLLAFLGVLLGLVGAVVSAARVQVGAVPVPWGLVLMAATLGVLTRAVLWSTGRRAAGATLVAGWFVASAAVLAVSPGGDVLIPDVPRSYAYLGVSFALGLAAVVWPLPRGHAQMLVEEARPGLALPTEEHDDVR